MYRHVEYYPGDPILSLVETFKRDERPEKVNLSIGIYFDDEGKMPVLDLPPGRSRACGRTASLSLSADGRFGHLPKRGSAFVVWQG